MSSIVNRGICMPIVDRSLTAGGLMHGLQKSMTRENVILGLLSSKTWVEIILRCVLKPCSKEITNSATGALLEGALELKIILDKLQSSKCPGKSSNIVWTCRDIFWFHKTAIIRNTLQTCIFSIYQHDSWEKTRLQRSNN